MKRFASGVASRFASRFASGFASGVCFGPCFASSPHPYLALLILLRWRAKNGNIRIGVYRDNGKKMEITIMGLHARYVASLPGSAETNCGCIHAVHVATKG